MSTGKGKQAWWRWTLLLGMVLSIPAKGQIFLVQPYYERDGLPTNIIADVAQDQDGVLWVLTDQGLTRYDGTQWNPVVSEQDLPTSWKSHLELLPNGKLLAVGLGENRFSIALIDGDSVTAMHADNWDIAQDSQPVDIAVSTEPDQSTAETFQIAWLQLTGLWEVASHETQWHEIVLPPQDSTGGLLGVHYLNNKLRLQTELGIFERQATGDWQRVELAGLPDQRVFKWLNLHQTGTSFLVGSNWVATLKNGKVQQTWPLKDDSFHRHSDITQSKNGLVFFNSVQQFYCFNSRTGDLKPFRTNQEDAAPNMARLLVDHENNLWIGTYRGLYKINSFRFYNYTQDTGLGGKEGAAITELSPGLMFLGHNDNYTLLKQGKIRSRMELGLANGLGDSPNRFHSVVKHPTLEEWWVAAGKLGVGKLNSEGKINFAPYPGIEQALSADFVGDTLLVVNEKELFFLKDGAILKTIKLGYFVRQVKALPDGRIVLATADGLYKVRNHEIIRIADPIGELHSNYYDIATIDDHVFVASDRGLLEWRGDSLYRIEYGEKRQRRPIYDLLITKDQMLWLGTDDGIFIVPVEGPATHYSIQDGLSGTEVNRNSLFQDSQGHVWIGTNHGVSEYLPELDSGDQLIPRTSLVAVQERDQLLPIEGQVRLPYHRNSLIFRYRGLSYYNEQDINYRVRLHGFDSAWRYLNANITEQTYTNLPWGRTYQFEVQARKGESSWSESAVSGYYHVRTPFTSTGWFYGLMLLLAVGSGFLVRNWITRERNRKYLEQQVNIKTQAIAQSEEELRAQNENLLKINQELDRFVYSASHDLSAPLKSISGLLHIAKLDHGASQEQREQYLQMIEKSVQQLNKFIRELIDFSRNSRMEPELTEIDLPELIEQLLENLRFMEDFDRVEFTFEYDLEASTVITDEFRLKVILNNLLSNAVKFQRIDADPPKVKVSTEANERGWYITVADNGQGIEIEYAERIFEMFFRASESASGSGLGLYIAKEAAERVGGQLSLETVPGASSTFRIFLPRA